MSQRTLHPREESYRWAIERLDEVFGAERVHVIPRNHYHVIAVSVSGRPGSRAEEITLRTPTQDVNKRPDREEFLESWIAGVQERSKGKSKARA